MPPSRTTLGGVVRFTVHNVMWLTIAVAIFAAVARLLGADTLAIIAALVCGVYLFAPLLLALASSFFQKIPPGTRKRFGYVVLGALWACALMASLPFQSLAPFAVLLVTFAFWVTQIDIYNDLHASQER